MEWHSASYSGKSGVLPKEKVAAAVVPVVVATKSVHPRKKKNKSEIDLVLWARSIFSFEKIELVAVCRIDIISTYFLVIFIKS